MFPGSFAQHLSFASSSDVDLVVRKALKTTPTTLTEAVAGAQGLQEYLQENRDEVIQTLDKLGQALEKSSGTGEFLEKLYTRFEWKRLSGIFSQNTWFTLQEIICTASVPVLRMAAQTEASTFDGKNLKKVVSDLLHSF